MTLQEKMARLRKAVAQLPADEQAPWLARIAAIKVAAREVAVGLDPASNTTMPYDFPDFLPLANMLDGMYDAVSDRVVEVSKNAGTAVKRVVDEYLPSGAIIGLIALGLYLWSKKT
jgi:hypothetical protein